MNILTLVTKRSVRESEPARKLRLFLSSKHYDTGSVIEIIDGNRKSPAYVYACEPASVYKQEIRSGALDLSKVRYSKTGPHAGGAVIQKYEPTTFQKYIEYPEKAQASDDLFLKGFFPKKRKPQVVKKYKKKRADSFASLSIDSYFSGEKTHHSEMHELVDTIRNYFGEDAKYGQGSFSYYLGFFKKIPNTEIYQMFEEAKRSNKSLNGQKKLFWWKVGQYIKNQKK